VNALFRRELGSTLRSPVGYAVGALFLVVQGTLFWGLVEVLADPTQPAPFGSVLSSLFGGQVLYWLDIFVVVAVATMRLVAEERRTGTWETLMTAPVSDASVVLAKWAAASIFAALLWLPTLTYPLLVAALAPSGTAVDVGVVASSYLGVVVQLAAFVAIGTAASAATRVQMVAAAVTVLTLVALLTVGQLPTLVHWEHESWLRAVLEHLDIQGHLAAAAQGELSSAALFFYASLTAWSLWLAYALLARGRLRPDSQVQRWIAAALLAVIGISCNVVAGRHDLRIDVSGSGRNRLEDATRVVLERVSEPVQVLVVSPTYARFQPVFNEVERVLGRMREVQPLLQVSFLDPLDRPGVVDASAREFGLEPSELAEGGMLVVTSGARREVVELLDLAAFGADDLGVGAVSRFVAEAAVASAVAEVSEPETPLVCFTDANGEVVGTVAAELDRRLARDGLASARIGDASQGVPRECRVVATLAPRFALSAASARAIAEHLGRGGGLLVASGGQSASKTGLELALAELGLAFANGIVVDADAEVGQRWTWATTRGHAADHPITSAFHDRRSTLWHAPRPVIASPSGKSETTTLVVSGPSSVVVQGASSEPGPVAVAAAGARVDTGARGVAWGGGVGAELEVSAGNLELLVASLSWAAGRDRVATAGNKAPDAVRLMLQARDRVLVFVLCVVVVPLSYILLGGLVWWRRRRV